MSESVDRGWLVRNLLDVPLFESLDYTQIGEVIDIAEHRLFSSLIQMLYVRLHDVNNEMQDLQEKAIRLRKRVEGLSPDDPLIAELFPE